LKFWDSSALVALVFEEAASHRVRALLSADPEVVVSFLARIEVESAICRRSRGQSPDVRRIATAKFTSLETTWVVVDPSLELMIRARRAAATHGLRGGDAIQLASAMAASTGATAQLPFVTTDDELIAAAIAEGFPVLP
jgi:predicted nucleic acid-binding protein